MADWFAAAGMDVHLDATGSVIGRYAGLDPRPRLLLGSHMDTVRNAGIFDGNLGVMMDWRWWSIWPPAAGACPFPSRWWPSR